MDAAAKTVESLTQHILPERPHHLSYNPQWRYRPRPEEAVRANGTTSSRRFEEWHNTRLQYMTLVSQADRGTLLTRSYYDMREEPPRPVPREVSALAKSAGDKKKKLSLSDYRNKKTGAASSASPPEPAITKQKECERAALGPAAAVGSAQDAAAPPSNPTNPKPPQGGPKLHEPQPSSVHAKQRQPREGAVDVKLPPKPPSLPPKPPSPSAKKRSADADDEARPQKRPKPDDRQLPVNRDDAQRRKERPQHTARDVPPHKPDRPSSSSSLPNGRAILKGAMKPTRNPSPAARPRRDSVNGVRPNPGGSSRNTPTKADASKSSVPPLLSPLHLSFDDHEASRPDDEDASSRKEKKRRDDAGDGATSTKTKRLEPAAAAASKKSKPSVAIPPLLSPTLPPAVEAELRKRKKTSPESVDDRSRDALNIKKRPVAADKNDEEPSRLGHRRRLTVTLVIPERLRQSVKGILASPVGRKDAQGRERAGSDEASQPTQARKRPLSSIDPPAESTTGIKRPRASDVVSLSRVAVTPSTPSKKSTAMSRVSSNNSMAQTPGETVSATPKAIDRRLNGQNVPSHKSDRPEIKALADKEERLMRKGKSLKHDADIALRKYRVTNATSGLASMPSDSRDKLGYVLSLESIIAFVMAFQAQNLWRSMVNKRSDHSIWASMFPLLELLQTEMRTEEPSNSQPLYALLLLLHAVCIDELLKCYMSVDNVASCINFENLLRLERKRVWLWPMIRETNTNIGNAALRVDVTPWYDIDEITDLSLRILRKWCSEEKIEWTPEPMLRDFWPIKAGHT